LVAEQLGHLAPVFRLEIYAHVMPSKTDDMRFSTFDATTART
jgi:hypothetical protein